MKKLVIFDLDGTLMDSLEDLAVAANHMLRQRGLPLHELHEYRAMLGNGIRKLVQRALPEELGNDEACLDDCLADFKAYYSAHIDVHTRPYPGMVELLNKLDALGIKMAVASNKFQSGTEHLIHKFFPGIDFVAILGNREGYPLKPSPEIVAEVLAKAGLPKEDAVMVGDSPTDMMTAANGGIDAVAVTWGYRSKEQLAGHLTVDTVEQLRDVIVLNTPRLRFRRWTDTDADSLFQHASDPDVGPRAGWPPHQSKEESLRVIRELFSNDHTWALELKSTGEAIGCMRYYTSDESNIDLNTDEAEVGYWIAKPYWNQGLCTEALNTMAEFCFHEKGFHALYGDFLENNPASGRVMEKCGFQNTGQMNGLSCLYQGEDRPVKIMKLSNVP